MLNKKALFLIICCVGVMGFIIAGDLISVDKKDYIRDGNFLFEKKQDISFIQLSDGFQINGVSFTNPNYVSTDVLEEKTKDTYETLRFIPDTDNSISKTRDEVYTWSKKPDRIKEVSYFTNIEDWVKYMGGEGGLDEIEGLCKDGKNPRCDHYEYRYLILEYGEDDFTLSTKKVGLTTGDVYDIQQTKTGFTAIGLSEKANDIVYSSGKIIINGTESCDSLFTFIKDNAPECHNLNMTQDSTNHTSITLSCELHINGTLNECVGYSMEFLLDEIPSSTGIIFYYNNSRMNMSYGEIKFSGTKTGKLGIVPIDEFVENATQYFKRFKISSDTDVASDMFNHMYVTGDHLDLIWIKPSAGIVLTAFDVAIMNGTNDGINLYGGMIAFPIRVYGEIFSDSSLTAGNNYAYYVWGPDNLRIEMTGGKYIGQNTDPFVFNGGGFGAPIPVNNTFKFTDTERVGFTGTMGTYYGAGNTTLLYTPNYVINESGNDNPVTANISITSLSGDANPDFYYNEIANVWNTPIVYAMYNYKSGAFVRDTIYTTRMTLTNSSYFPINSSLDVSKTTINGKKDMIKIPYYYELDLNSDTGIQLF